jgi:hypothetical protein
VVAIGCVDCPNVCSTTFARDAVYGKVSSLGILDHSEHVDVFLNSNVDSFCAKVSMQNNDLLQFQYYIYTYISFFGPQILSYNSQT